MQNGHVFLTGNSGGNAKAINNWDSNAKAGIPSKGLLQVIDPTFNAYHVPGTANNIWDPLANIAAAINYAYHRYGPSLMRGSMGLGSGHGYAKGGAINEPVTGIGMLSGELYTFGENGREWVVPEQGGVAAPAGGGMPAGMAAMLAQVVGHDGVHARTGRVRRRGGPGRGGTAFRRRRAVEHPVTTPPRPGRDSLVLAGTIELLGGGVPSTHPSCPGAIFRLAPGYDEGAPQPSADVVTKILTGGSRPHGRWADNRTVKLPVIIFAPDRPTLVAARELLAQLLDVDQFETRWHRAGAPGPMVLDCYRAGAAGPGYSVLEEREGLARIEVTFGALPYGRSDVRETVWFPSPVIGGVPAPVYRDWEEIDRFGPALTDVHSEVQTGSWSRHPKPGGPGPYDGSAHWNPLAGANTPVYHRRLPAPRDITGRQMISLWVGLGNSNGQWRAGNLTFRLTLYDTGMSWMQFGGTFKLAASDNWSSPNFTRIALPIPAGTGFHLEELAQYVIEVPNFTTAARMGDLYLNCLGAAPAAARWPAVPGTVRGTVYSVALDGTARAPVSLRFQPPRAVGAGQAIITAAGAYSWDPHGPGVNLASAPDGTENAVQVRIWGPGAAGGSRTIAPTSTDHGLSGGGGGSGVAGDDHYPVLPGQVITGVNGTGGQPNTTAAVTQPAATTWGTQTGAPYLLRATGGHTPAVNDWHGGAPGDGEAVPGAQPVPGGLIRYPGGAGAYGRPAGTQYQGSGGGGGAAGTTGPGKAAPGQPGGEGGPGGGHGGGGHGPSDNGRGNPGGGPGAGGGGATRISGTAQQLGAVGANGRVQVNWLTSVTPMRTLLVHMPGPETPTTFAPLVSVGDAGTPADGREWEVTTPQPGQPVRYSGTYTGVIVVSGGGGGWDAPNLLRDITVRIIQHDYRVTLPALPPPDSVTSAIIGGATYAGLRPDQDAAIQAGFLILGAITLPLRWLPPDNQTAYYAVTVESRWSAGQPSAGQVTGDRFMDLLLLDVTGQTVLLSHHGGGFTNYFLDEPDTTQGLGGILGSNLDRTQARSVTDALVRLSGGPFVLEPGQGNLLLAYSADSAGSPSLGLDYYPRWWFDRADDLGASGPAGGGSPRASWLNGQPLPGPPPPVLTAGDRP